MRNYGIRDKSYVSLHGDRAPSPSKKEEHRGKLSTECKILDDLRERGTLSPHYRKETMSKKRIIGNGMGVVRKRTRPPLTLLLIIGIRRGKKSGYAGFFRLSFWVAKITSTSGSSLLCLTAQSSTCVLSYYPTFFYTRNRSSNLVYQFFTFLQVLSR